MQIWESSAQKCFFFLSILDPVEDDNGETQVIWLQEGGEHGRKEGGEQARVEGCCWG